MKDIITVSKFTMLEMIKRKSFIISTIILAIVIVIGFNVPKLISAFSGNGSVSQGSKIIISDNENVFEGKLDKLNEEEIGYEIEVTPNTVDEIKEKINNDEIQAGVIIEKQGNNINFTYIVNDAMGMMPDQLAKGLEDLYTTTQVEKIGLTQEKIDEIFPEFTTNVEQTEEIKGNFLAITAISVLLFYAIYFCAYQVSSSITTEKTSKIMETLVTSTSPRTIVIGKTIGIGLGGLIQSLYLC